MTKTFIAKNLDQTWKLAENLAKQIISAPDAAAAVIGLNGGLGSGKTSFVQEFAKVLGIKEKITSPTFVIQKNYKLRSKNRKFLIHIDTYRIKDPKEILDLGWKELIKDPKNIILVEWAEKIKKILPKKYIQINFEHLGENKRKITVLR